MVLDLTQTGINYLLHNLAGGPPPVFTAIVLGNGADAGGANATALSNPLVSIAISNLEREENFVNLSGILNNNDITSDFRANEMGVLIQNPDNEAESLLFAYGYVADNKAMLIPSITDRLFEITENVMVFVGAAENVSAVINSSLATVSKTEFNEHLEKKNPHKLTKADVGLGNVPNVSTNDQTPTYETAKELAELKSNEKMSALLGKVAKAISSLIAHLKDKENPHGVTAEGISAAEAEHKHSTNDITEGILKIARGGLGADNMEDARKNLDINNVPNVTTNDQTPTYEVAKELAELISGEKLSVAFGKIKKAIAVLKAHLGAKNPHSLSASDVGAAPSGHTHSASDVGAAAKSVAVTATLSAANWAGTCPFTQRLYVNGITANGNGVISVSQNAINVQRDAARKAMLSVTIQGDGYIVVNADGSIKPTVDIPVTIILLG